MKKNLLRDFIATVNTFSDSEYLKAKIELELAPILAGIKPSSLMTFSKDSRNLYQVWETIKDKCCAELKLQYFEMRKTKSHILVLFYNPMLLSKVLDNAENQDFLSDMGYQEGLSLQQIMQLLRGRFSQGFPHEIGLFLGIAKEDVKGFMQNGGAQCLFCRYWKVYHKPREAHSLFCSYDTARFNVMQNICKKNALFRVPA